MNRVGTSISGKGNGMCSDLERAWNIPGTEESQHSWSRKREGTVEEWKAGGVYRIQIIPVFGGPVEVLGLHSTSSGKSLSA